ncbi:Polyketide cyclase / dehydrase and lipid transport [Promicromonospora umidemergens]|uniref:Polyketide cyclase/dehydrase/lipid transport protein n=1 Tax=Promicromonospora umidemergens TaxID=629679 RepID=A0ABP8XXJ7_9MICO|nr:SRPBCC family protein [Promicromonospora umidemergens]MCP2284298.1 Polyketide cyclase / dehydrase and lipid transport [Promicromonospora umidemergens]
MPNYSTSAEIDASPEAVWAVLSDIEHMPDWTPSITSVAIIDGPNPPDVGTQVRIEQPRLPLAVWLIDEWDPPRHFAWISEAPGVTTQAEHLVERLPDGRSLVTLAITQTGGLAWLLGRLVMGRTREYVDTELSSLRARVTAEG